MQQPEDIARGFAEAWNRHDADGIAALFDEDAEFINVTGLWWHDRESIRRAHAYGFTHIFPQSVLSLTQTRVKWLSEDIAIVHARFRLTGQTPPPDLPAPRPRTNLFTFVVHRQPDRSFRCAAAHNTDVVPASETNILTADGTFRAVSYQQTNLRKEK